MIASSAANPSPDDQSRSPSVVSRTGEDAPALVRGTLDRIAGFADLAQDWDSYGGAPSSAVARNEAERWVEIVADLFAPRVGPQARPYSVAPLADGGVQLEWRGPGGALEIDVAPDGTLGYLLTNEENSQPAYHEVDDASWSEILRLLIRVFAP
jgi:hypothetical protein